MLLSEAFIMRLKKPSASREDAIKRFNSIFCGNWKRGSLFLSEFGLSRDRIVERMANMQRQGIAMHIESAFVIAVCDEALSMVERLEAGEAAHEAL